MLRTPNPTLLPEVLLDTDTLSQIMKQHPQARIRSQAYLRSHRYFTFSIITQSEILRGLKAKNARAQEATFDNLCSISRILDIDDVVIRQASDIYADLHRQGLLIGDADILIAATALVHNLMLITNNENHFNRIAGLRIENWLK